MSFKRLNLLVQAIITDISIVNKNNKTDDIFIDNFCECLHKNIITASTVALPIIDGEQKYLQAVQVVLNCYTTILQSPCLVPVAPETLTKLLWLTQKNR